MNDILKLLKESIWLELVIEDLGIGLNDLKNDIEAYLKNVNNDTLAKIVCNSLITYTFTAEEIYKYKQTYSDDELREYAIRTSIRILLNDDIEKSFNIDEVYEKNKSLGFYGDLLMELFLHAFYGSDKLVCRGKLYDPNTKMEPTGFDAFHIISDESSSEFWLGESKITNSKTPSETIKNIVFSFDRVFKENYLRDNLLLITKRNLTTSDTEFTKFLEQRKITLGLKEINLINDLISKTTIDRFIYPIFLCFEMKNSLKESLEYVKEKILENVALFKNTVGEISDFNEIDAKIFFILFPIEKIDDYRKAVLRWIIQQK